MKAGEYVQVPLWVISHLKLTGNKALVYGYIHGFSQHGDGSLHLTLETFASNLGISKMQLIRILKELVDAKIVLKSELSGRLNNRHVKRYEYVVNEDFIPSLAPTNGNNMLPTNGNNMLPTNGNNMLPTNGNNMLPIYTNIANSTIENNSPTGEVSASALKPKSKKKKSEKTPTLQAKAKEIFLDVLRKRCGDKVANGYYYDAKNAGQLKSLINKVRFDLINKKKKDDVTDDEILKSFRCFLESIKDNWVENNFDIPTISGRYNAIRITILNGRKDLRPDEVGRMLKDETSASYYAEKLKDKILSLK